MCRNLLVCFSAVCLLTAGARSVETMSAPVGAGTPPATLHPQANLMVWPPPGDGVSPSGAMISPGAAADSAAVALTNQGVESPMICEARWIAAAVSGYLVDALGALTIDGCHYSAFRIGIRDGAEAQHGAAFRAGTVFTFFAMGIDSICARIWYPPPGPDARPTDTEPFPEQSLAYEFLLAREAFETLPRRYPRGESNE